MQPEIVVAIFSYKNIDPNSVLQVKVIKKILIYQGVFNQQKISDSQTPLRFTHSDSIPINRRDANPIAIVRPKKFLAIWDNLSKIES